MKGRKLKRQTGQRYKTTQPGVGIKRGFKNKATKKKKGEGG